MTTVSVADLPNSSITLADKVLAITAAGVTNPSLVSLNALAATLAPAIKATEHPYALIPEDFGAVGDGTHDDTAAVQACLNAASGTAVKFQQNGTYLVNGLTVPSGSRLIVNGAIYLKSGANTHVLSLVPGTVNVVIEGTGTLYGNRANQAGGNSGGVNAFQAYNVIIRDITVAQCLNWPINIVQCHDVLTEGVKASSCGNSFEFAAGSWNCWARGCEITNIDDIGFAFYGGVYNSGIVDSNIHHTPQDGINVLNDADQNAPCRDITIANNIINDCGGGAISVATGHTGLVPHQHIIIDSNRGYNNRSQANYAGAGVHLTCGVVVQITNNMFGPDGTAGKTTGIYVDGTSGVAYTTIANNVIVDQGAGGSGPSGLGIFTNGADVYTVIRGNTIVDTRTPVLMLQGMDGTAGPNCLIEDNIVRNMAQHICSMNLSNQTVVTRQDGVNWTFNSGVTSNGAINVVGGAGNVALSGTGSGAATLTTFGSAANVDLNVNLQGAGRNRFSNPIIMTNLLPTSYANESAAAAGGVMIGELYRSGNQILIRLS